MIQVPRAKVGEVEYLIEQSLQGNHVLFRADELRRVFSGTGLFRDASNAPLSDEEAYSVEHHLERMLEMSSLENKRAYLESLDESTFTKVVKVYFNILENNLYASEARH